MNSFSRHVNKKCVSRYSVFVQWKPLLTMPRMENLSRLCHRGLAHTVTVTYDGPESRYDAMGCSRSHNWRSLREHLEDAKFMAACHGRNDVRPA